MAERAEGIIAVLQRGAYARGVEDTLARLASDEVQQAAARALHELFVDSDPPEYPCQVCPPRARVVLAAALSAREEAERVHR